jgi:peptidoglycan/LPS O-acetylase OafA/YrhL
MCPVTIPSLVPHGYMGVDLCFFLSGFIMSYAYLASFEAHSLRAFPDFLGKRVARWAPLNIAVLLTLMALAAVSASLLDRSIFFTNGICPSICLPNC